MVSGLLRALSKTAIISRNEETEKLFWTQNWGKVRGQSLSLLFIE
jgi:hypothetical protein